MDTREENVLSGALQLTDLRSVLDAVTEQAYEGLRRVTADASPSASDEERRRALLLHLHNTRQRLLRLLVVLQWSNKAKAVQEVSNVLEKASVHAATFREAADQLFHQHNDPFLIRAPMHDVPTALDVLQTGGYDLLPSVIESLRAEPEPPPRKRQTAIQLMEQLLRTQLLKEALPPGLRVTEITGGCVTLRNSDAFEVRLILVPAPAVVEGGTSPSGAEDPIGSAGEEALDIGPSASAEGGSPTGGVSTSRCAAEGSGGNTEVRVRRRAEDWRWRIMSLTILPGPRKDFWVTPSQAAYLQRGTDELMWRAADAIAARDAGAPEQVIAEEPGAVGEAGGQLAEARGQPAGVGEAEKASGSVGERATSEAGASVLGSEALMAAAESAVKQGKLQKPLEVMQRVLCTTAHRLLVLEAMAWAQRQAGDAKAAWHGLLKREKAKTIPMGGRVSYWFNINSISPAELQALGESKGSIPQATAASPVSSSGPAIELGLDAVSCLALVHEPELRQVGERQTEAEGILGGPVALSIEMHTADLEAVMLQAATANAAIQLAGLQELLQVRRDVIGNGGCVLLHSRSPADAPSNLLPGELLDAQTQGGSRNFASGVLELLSGPHSLLRVSVQLTTGRLLLRQGAAFLENADIASFLRNEEDKVFALQRARPPGNSKVSPGLFTLASIAKTLEKLFLLLCLRHRFVQLAALAADWGLSQAPLPTGPLKVFMKANPLAPQFASRHIVQLVFPPPPPLTDVLQNTAPDMETSPEGRTNGHHNTGLRSSEIRTDEPKLAGAPESRRWDGPQVGRVREILGEDGRGLQFSLVAELKAGMRWEFMLCTMSCDRRGVPLKVLKLVKIPDLQPATASASASASVAAAAGSKRKREAEDPTSLPAEATNRGGEEGEPGGEAGGEEGAGGGGPNPTGREQLAELSEVVRWCRERMVWEQLWLQLQVMGVPFTRGLAPFTPPTKRLRAKLSQPLAPSTPAESAVPAPGPRASKGPLSCVLAASHAASLELPAVVVANGLPVPNGLAGLQRRLWVRSLVALEQLDIFAQLSKKEDAGSGSDISRPYVEFSVTPATSTRRDDGAWAAEVFCDYLARLPESCGGCSEAAEQLPADAHIARTSEGLLLSYSPATGGTAGTALRDIGRIARLHTFLARFNLLSAAQWSGDSARSAPPHVRESPQVSGDGSLLSHQQGWEVPASGRVALAAVGPLAAVLNVFAAGAGRTQQPGGAQESSGAREDAAITKQEADDAGFASVELRDPRTPPSTVFEDGAAPDFVHASEDGLDQLIKQQVAKDPRRLSDLFDGMGGNDGFSLDSVDLQQFRTQQSVLPSPQLTPVKQQPSIKPEPVANGIQAAEEADDTQLAEAAEDGSVNRAEESHVLQLVVRWGAQDSLDSQAGGGVSEKLRCHLSAEPRLPEPLLEVLADMADAGEEEVLLDALCICMPPAAILARSLSMPSLSSAGLLASDVVLRWPRPPYRAGLLIQMHSGESLIVAFHFFANSLVWLGLQQLQAHVKSAPTSLSEASVQTLIAQLSLVPGVRLSEPKEAEPPAVFKEETKRHTANGVWCRIWALEGALSCVLLFAGGVAGVEERI